MFRYLKITLAIALSSALFACGGGGTSPTPESGDFQISSQPTLHATEDINYSYQITTNKGADQSITFELVDVANGMQISDTGLLTWIPTEGINSSGEVKINATLDNGDSVTQTFTIPVTAVNDAPVLSAVTEKSIESGKTLSFQLTVTDPDDSDLTFELIEGPNGLTINTDGLVTFTSVATASKNQMVTIQVRDGGEDAAQPSHVSFSLKELYYLSITGNLQNYYTNEIIANGPIQLSINGNIIDNTSSQANGLFEFKFLDSMIFNHAVISSSVSGYTETSRRVAYTEITQENNLYLPPVHAEVTFNATEDSNLSVDGKTLVVVGKDSFVNANGDIVSGEIKSELFIIDPTLDIDLMPGDMITNTPDDSSLEVPIESFGAITATFTNDSGESLQLADGKTAEIRIPASGNNPPATIPLYYYDSVNGIWVEEGIATLTQDVTGDYYLGNVSHFTTWNADRIYETITISGCVVDTENIRITDARINSEGQTYNGRASAFSDNDGNFSVSAKMDSTLFISASNGQQSRTVTVNSYSEDITLDGCLVLDNATSKIELKWGENPSDLDSHFYGPTDGNDRFHVYYANDSVVINGASIYLDVDDTSSYGPEVITIPDYSLPGIYQYAVYKYSGIGDIQRSETRVELIINDQRTLFVPPEGEAKKWWNVFEIEVSEDGTTTVNTINEWTDGEPDQSAISNRNSITNKASITTSKLQSKYYAK